MAVGIGHGTTFRRGNADGPPETYTQVGFKVVSISGPGMSKDTPENSHLGSTDRYREFLSGMRDGGEVTLDVSFDPGDSSIDDALTDFNADAARSYRIQWTDGTTLDFEAHCTDWSPEVSFGDKMSIGLTYKVTGAPTFTQA